MRMGWRAIAGIGALVLLIASTAAGKFEHQWPHAPDRTCLREAVRESKTVAGKPYPQKILATLTANGPGLAGFWHVLSDNAEVRLTGEMLSNYARYHPPKRWRGFEIAVLDISVKGEVHIRAHISGYMIHTPVDISGYPDYDAKARAIFFHVTKATLPKDTSRPILSRFNAMLTPLATYIAQNVAEVIPVKRIKAETGGGWMFLTTVESVRVDKDRVVLVLHGYRIAAAVALMLCALLFAACLTFLWLKHGRRRGNPI